MPLRGSGPRLGRRSDVGVPPNPPPTTSPWATLTDRSDKAGNGRAQLELHP